MAHPVVYYVRHGETDWNVERRLQGRQDIPLNANGRAQAARCGDILRELFVRDGKTPADLDYVASPLGRARITMELLRGALGLDPQAYAVDERLIEISFGTWEGKTLAEMAVLDSGLVAARTQDKWAFLPPGGESYAALADRMGGWYATLARDTVVVAHGGTARGLIAHLKIIQPRAAPLYDIGQGVVYVIEPGSITLHG
jgi:broad specificity phosphatase PhoE